MDGWMYKKAKRNSEKDISMAYRDFVAHPLQALDELRSGTCLLRQLLQIVWKFRLDCGHGKIEEKQRTVSENSGESKDIQSKDCTAAHGKLRRCWQIVKKKRKKKGIEGSAILPQGPNHMSPAQCFTLVDIIWGFSRCPGEFSAPPLWQSRSHKQSAAGFQAKKIYSTIFGQKTSPTAAVIVMPYSCPTPSLPFHF